MELVRAGVLVVGATGAIGGQAAGQLAESGIATALAGRDRDRLAERASALDGRPWRTFEAYDLDGCARLAPWAKAALGGLDGLVVAIGVAGFGSATEVSDASAEHLFTVNALAPMAVVRGALGVLSPGGVVAVVTGEIVDRPARGMADYAAAKTALATWLGVAGREARRARLEVMDVRMPHLDTSFAAHPAVGTAPPFGPGADPVHAVREHLVHPLLNALSS
ncbi:SDR family NAD(P)-dependent oxidoreductase [Streptomyces sp. NPDC015130]|uniref:SDR family NAD(P)-dependent oxidoreductase n=1 Tax=Streptomyces sp. NPDC015130 TaxID=3364940 RepID=UPI0036F7561B